MEAAVAENRVTGVPETSVTLVATVVRAETGADEVESTGGKPRMEPTVGGEKADWVLDILESF